jgi:hypothetical protein
MKRKMIWPWIALAGSSMAISVIAVLGAQAPQGTAFDFTQAALAEVKNAQGQVVLTGRFAVSADDDDEEERKATLAATSVDADASGEAEVEVSGSGDNRKQEVEFSVHNVQPGGTFTFVIDGRSWMTAAADDRGRIEVEREVALPTTRDSR